MSFYNYNGLVAVADRRPKKIPRVPIEERGEPPLCICNCGKLVNWNRHTQKWNKYIKGHYWKSKNRSEKTKVKIAKKLRRRRLSLKTRAKMSRAKKGVKLSEEHKAKISKKQMGHEVSIKTREKIGKGHSGRKSHFYVHGHGRYPYTSKFNSQLKERIRDRDNHICQLCDRLESECDQKLDVHHIDYKKKNCNPNNLISLCRSCHLKTNDREKRLVYLAILIHKINK